jgi:hypothetical protein
MIAYICQTASIPNQLCIPNIKCSQTDILITVYAEYEHSTHMGFS